MSLICCAKVCIWKGMRGNWDMERRMTDEPNPKLAFVNPIPNIQAVIFPF